MKVRNKSHLAQVFITEASNPIPKNSSNDLKGHFFPETNESF